MYDDSVLNNKKPGKISKLGSVNNLGNKLDFYRTPLKLETDLFKSDNVVFAVIPDFYAINECSKSEVTGGFYGTYFVDKILNINFKEDKLFILDSLKKGKYTEIESKFFGLTQVQIKLNVNRRSEWFHFDTANVLNPIILHAKSEIIKNIEYDYIVKSNRLSLVKKQNSTYFYEDLKISFGNEQLNSYAVTNDGFQKYKFNNVGIQFIKNYNLIINYQSQKVYYKNFKESGINSFKVSKNQLNKSGVENGKLVVIQTLDQIENQNYDLGDKILNVNGTPINKENICSYQELLNNSDWHMLDIETQQKSN